MLMAIWRDLSVMDILDDGCGEISNVSNNPYSQRRVIFYLMSWQAMRRRLWTWNLWQMNWFDYREMC
jgi:hypothetical protein